MADTTKPRTLRDMLYDFLFAPKRRLEEAEAAAAGRKKKPGPKSTTAEGDERVKRANESFARPDTTYSATGRKK